MSQFLKVTSMCGNHANVGLEIAIGRRWKLWIEQRLDFHFIMARIVVASIPGKDAG